ncbi:MAG: SufD family Fe-S cluster assembly protein [Bacilli bacterium]|nr:SufD family Fe-S cluster assembly protein [Bacilli bacterium]
MNIINLKDNGTFTYYKLNDKQTINIEKGSNIIINLLIKDSINDIIINIEENSNLIINYLTINDNTKIEINLNKERSNVSLYYSSINYKESNYIVNINHNSKNTTSKIINHGISVLGNKIDFTINGNIPLYADNCICNQDSKIINIKDSKSIIKPNLFIENYNVEANHSAYIGQFNKDKLFYLESRGIKNDQAIFLLLKSFMINNMSLPEELESKFIYEINKIREV